MRKENGSMEKMKALRLHAVNDLRIDTQEIPVPKGEEILLKVEACGICGSDIPRTFLLGTRVNPVTLGHEFAGTVCAVGDEKNNDLLDKRAAVFNIVPCHQCENCRKGDYAHCEHISYLGTRIDGGFAQYCLVPSRFHLVVCEDEKVSSEELCMTEPAAVALHATRASKIQPWETLAILGAGPIGILIARWARLFGVQNVVLADIVEEKIRFANEHGVTAVHSDELAEKMREISKGVGADVVIEGTGSSGGWKTAIDAVRANGRLILLGNPQKDVCIAVSDYSNILRKELALKSCWNSYFGTEPLNEWKFVGECLQKGLLTVKDLITCSVGIEELPELFREIYTGKRIICKAIYTADKDEKIQGRREKI